MQINAALVAMEAVSEHICCEKYPPFPLCLPPPRCPHLPTRRRFPGSLPCRGFLTQDMQRHLRNHRLAVVVEGLAKRISIHFAAWVHGRGGAMCECGRKEGSKALAAMRLYSHRAANNHTIAIYHGSGVMTVLMHVCALPVLNP